jgi:succinate dehydrogenase / fumarate reductase cytochrome b subunit
MGVYPARKRPVYLNLLKIRQPIGAIVSIIHRITGVLLTLLIAPALYAFDLSLRSPADYQRVTDALSSGGGRLASLVVLWMLVQHLYSGARLLLLDLNVGVRIDLARRSAWMTFVASGITVIAIGALVI